MATYITLPSLSAQQILTASYLNQLNDNLRVISVHDHSGSTGEGSASVQTSGSGASPFLARQWAVAHIAPSQVNWNTDATDGQFIFRNQKNKTSGCSASLSFPVALFSGTYELFIMYSDYLATCPTTVWLLGASIASIQVYNTANYNSVCRFSGIAVASSGSTVLQFTNPSGTGNNEFRLSAWKIRRTGS